MSAVDAVLAAVALTAAAFMAAAFTAAALAVAVFATAVFGTEILATGALATEVVLAIGVADCERIAVEGLETKVLVGVSDHDGAVVGTIDEAVAPDIVLCLLSILLSETAASTFEVVSMRDAIATLFFGAAETRLFAEA